jgi:prepilin-type N-terminal cleavage/methylation domain-containing protein
MKTAHTLLIVGFSLIELMVVIAISAILAFLTIPSYVQYSANSKGASLVSQLQNSINLAKSEAQHRNTQVKICALAADSAAPTATTPGTCNTQDSSWDHGWQIVVLNSNQLIYFVQPSVNNAITASTANITFQPSGIPTPPNTDNMFTVKLNGCSIGYRLYVSATGNPQYGGVQIKKVTCHD